MVVVVMVMVTMMIAKTICHRCLHRCIEFKGKNAVIFIHKLANIRREWERKKNEWTGGGQLGEELEDKIMNHWVLLKYNWGNKCTNAEGLKE